MVLTGNLYLLEDRFQSVQFIGYLNVLNVLVLPTFVYLWKRCGYVSTASVAVLASAVLGLLLAGIKSYIVFGVVAAFLTHFSFNRSFSSVLRFGGLVLVIFGFFTVYDIVIDIYLPLASQQVWVAPYLYVAGPWPALDQLLAHPAHAPGYWGVHLFYDFWKVWNLFYPDASFPSYVLDFTQVPTRFNVYTMNGESYLDFGYPGVFLFTLFLGFLAMRARLSAVRTDRFTSHLTSGMMGYFLFMSFFVNFLTHFYCLVMFLYIACWRLGETRFLGQRHGGGMVRLGEVT